MLNVVAIEMVQFSFKPHVGRSGGNPNYMRSECFHS